MKTYALVASCLCLAAVALAADAPQPVSVDGAQRALASQGLKTHPELIKKVLPTLTAAVQRRLELEEAVARAPKDLARALDRAPADEAAMARVIDALVRDAKLQGVLVSSDESWKLLDAAAPPAGWTRLDFKDEGWRPAVPQGTLGAPPWSPVSGFATPTRAQWIWSYASNTGTDQKTLLFRKRFVPPRGTATLTITADNQFEVFFDGQPIGHGDNWQRAVSLNLDFSPGTPHVLAVKVVNRGGPGGLLVDLR